ncbi:MAG: hypothetical protein JNL74_23890 [Fibrobacteres bacterium]|nr:hypothetical protein [Fibrobacterota bacterium]
MRKLIYTQTIILLSFSLTMACNIDKAAQFYQKGVSNWNSGEIWASLNEVDKCTDAEAYKLKALSFWRLTVLSFVDESKKDVKANALRTIENAEALEKIKGSSELSLALKGMSFQILSSLGVPSAIKNGPKAAEVQAQLEKNYSGKFWTRLVKGINQLQAPGFAGGNVDSALVTLQKLNSDFPDSSTVTTYLSLAYSKTKQKEKAVQTIDVLIKKEPLNKWAVMVKRTF